MNDSIDIEGTEFISAKRASKETGYARDYIGQLARGGHIAARRVEGLWYVSLESLNAYKTKASEYKPPAPPATAGEEIDTTVTFDGKDYVSAARGAKLTGYHQDYVGQLARTGKVESRQVGSRWFIAREALISHKKQKDALLAAVQAESVGLSHAARPIETHAPMSAPKRGDAEPWERAERSQDTGAFFTYTPQHAALVPQISQRDDVPVPLRIRSDAGRSATDSTSSASIAQISHVSSRRFVTPTRHASPHVVRAPGSKRSASRIGMPLAGAALTIVIVLTFGFTSLKDRAIYALDQLRGSGAQAASVSGGSAALAGAAQWVESLFAHQIEYKASR